MHYQIPFGRKLFPCHVPHCVYEGEDKAALRWHYRSEHQLNVPDNWQGVSGVSSGGGGQQQRQQRGGKAAAMRA